ncbi:MAG: hypothetical protein KDB83_01700 [Actinobacteria bacterium]|nr:hypothetical protein [Actinomycetota bacterium]
MREEERPEEAVIDTLASLVSLLFGQRETPLSQIKQLLARVDTLEPFRNPTARRNAKDPDLRRSLAITLDRWLPWAAEDLDRLGLPSGGAEREIWHNLLSGKPLETTSGGRTTSFLQELSHKWGSNQPDLSWDPKRVRIRLRDQEAPMIARAIVRARERHGTKSRDDPYGVMANRASTSEAGPPHPPSETIAAELQRAQEETVERLRRLPAGYPLHLDVLEMADHIRLVEVEDITEFAGGTGLYATRLPAGGGHGLSVLRGTRLAVVLGDPGSGKSTLLGARCASHIEQADGLAVFVRLDDLARLAEERRELTSRQSITRRTAAELVVEAWDNWRQGRTSAPARKKLVELILDSPNTLVALDGLDEVELTEGRSDLVRELVTRLVESPAQIVIASRVTSYSRPVSGSGATVTEYVVAPWDQAEARALVDLWFIDGRGNGQPPGKDSAIEALSDPSVSSLVRTPLVAGIVCFVAEEGSVANTIFGLYRQYLHRLLKRLWRPPGEQRRSTAEVNRARAAAQQAAWTMAQSGTGAWLDSATLARLLAGSDAPSEVLLDLYYRDGLLVPLGDPTDTDPLSQNVRWIHRTVHEHLVARQLAEVLVRDFQQGIAVVARAALLPAWAETLHHLSGALYEGGLLESVVQELWRLADLEDTPGERLRLTAADLLRDSAVPPDLKGIVLQTYLRHHRWWSAAEVDPDALLRHSERIRQAGRDACEVGSYLSCCTHLEPFPGTWEDLERMFEMARSLGLESEAEMIFRNVSWRIDRQRALESLMEVLKGSDLPPLIPGRLPDLEPGEAKTLVDTVDDSLEEGNPRPLLQVVDWHRSLTSDQAQRLRLIADRAWGAAFAGEVWASVEEERVFDVRVADPLELEAFARNLPNLVMFGIGLRLANEQIPLSRGLGAWVRAGYEAASTVTTWEPARCSTSVVHEDSEPEFRADWWATPDGVRMALHSLAICREQPTAERLTRFLRWYLADDPIAWVRTGLSPLDFIGLEFWAKGIDWHVRAVSGMQLMEAGEVGIQRRLVEWVGAAITAGLDQDPRESMTLLRQFVRALLAAPDVDPQVSQHLSLTIHEFGGLPPAEARLAWDLVLRTAESVSNTELRTVILDAVDTAVYQAGMLATVELRIAARSESLE